MSEFIIYIARHYWEDGEFAVWKASDNFPRPLLSWLKSNYSELVSGNRPKWVDYLGEKLFLFYKDEKEVHGRMATQLTVCLITGDGKNIDETLVYNNLKKITDIEKKDAPLQCTVFLSEKKTLKRSYYFILIIAASSFLYILNTLHFTETNLETIDKNTEIIDNKQIQHKSPDVKTSFSSEPSDTKKIKMAASTNCFKNWPELNKYGKGCIYNFVKEKCNDKTQSNYQSWLNKKKNDITDFKLTGCPMTTKDWRDESDFFKEIKLNKDQKEHLVKYLQNENNSE